MTDLVTAALDEVRPFRHRPVSSQHDPDAFAAALFLRFGWTGRLHVRRASDIRRRSRAMVAPDSTEPAEVTTRPAPTTSTVRSGLQWLQTRA